VKVKVAAMSNEGSILDIQGPIVTARLPEARIGEQVKLGKLGLMGEVIAREDVRAVIQVYENTEGLRPGEPAFALGAPLSVELGPGLLSGIFDGLERPLEAMLEQTGERIERGLAIPAIDRNKRWFFQPDENVKVGMQVPGGAMLGSVQENPSITHRILAPPDVSGELLDLAQAGEYTVDEVIGRVRDAQDHIHKLRLSSRWPVRIPRPFRKRDNAVQPLITGQRIMDTFFPLLKGGKGAIPGPFGAGKTVLQQQIARWADAQIVIYVGCGERGNELTEVLDTFPTLTDPHTGRPLMERTVLVANTSNMPVVAREVSVYVGMTLAEYFRDQGLDVVVVADSTSRWAEALREVAGRLGQMPVEEGYPAYLGSTLSAFYERAGRVETLNGQHGSVTLIGAISPPGGDFSEPVTSHTKDIIQTFWALSKELADARHYPAVDWLESFSLFVDTAAQWWHENIDEDWMLLRNKALHLLGEAEELTRIVNLVGVEALSGQQRWSLESAKLIREGLLQQSALEPKDSFCSPQKQFLLLKLMIDIHTRGAAMLSLGMPVHELLRLPLLTKARRWKMVYGSDEMDGLEQEAKGIIPVFDALRTEYATPAVAEEGLAEPFGFQAESAPGTEESPS
jgi:V/A-type H+-transporting ATPase subunit A